MSRPPRPSRPGRRTPLHADPLDYLDLEHAELVELQRMLAERELGLVSAGEEGDFARTLMDLSATVAHVLATYQDAYAQELWLRTARTARSLVEHGRRLGYQPDPGLAALGYVQIDVPDGREGELPAGFVVESAQVGEQSGQPYMTMATCSVTARHNRIQPFVWRERRERPSALDTFILDGNGYGLRAGEPVLVMGRQGAVALTVRHSHERPDGDTQVWVEAQRGIDPLGALAEEYHRLRLLARPRTTARRFGWQADRNRGRVHIGAATDESTATDYGVEPASWRDDPGPPAVFLDREVPDLGEGDWLRVETASGPVAARVSASGAASVGIVVDRHQGPEGDVERRLHGLVTAVRLQTAAGRLERGSIPLTATLSAGWSINVSFSLTRRPNPRLEGPDHELEWTPGLAVGDLLFQQTTDYWARARLLRIRAIRHDDDGTSTSITTDVVRADAGPFYADRTEYRGNVVRVGHGRPARKVLGGSDGVTPHQRFVIEAPVAWTPTAGGAAPALEIRVGGVRWRHQQDLFRSGPDDRHYQVSRDAAGATVILFGDGQRGAIPPAGNRHIEAQLRSGGGPEGNAIAGRVNRAAQNHPLIAELNNPLPITGGAAPADAETVRVQASAWVRSFGRAVSVQDHADLALLYPGVARATATWTELTSGEQGVQVVVADAEGGAVSARDALEAFIRARRDPRAPMELVDAEKRTLPVSLRVQNDPDFPRAAVEEAISARLREAFRFGPRDLGQPLFPSEIQAALEGLAGVVSVTVAELGAGVEVHRPAANAWVTLATPVFGPLDPEGGA